LRIMTPGEAALWASLAYKTAKAGRSIALKRGYQYYLFSQGAHQCVIGRRAGKTIVAFRGTELSLLNWQDLITSLRSRLVRFVGGGAGRVHDGYQSAVWALLPLIRPHLGGAVYLCGHSMGGAMATVAGALIKPAAVYSFNAPKCGDPVFAENYPAVHYRFESRKDVVSWYPSSTAEWAHVGPQILLASEGHSLAKIEALFQPVVGAS
jgi:predicted lipase